MKVAVVLTGHMRDWQTVFPNFKEKIIDRYHPDIFIHTWDTVGYWIDSPVSVHPLSPPLDIDSVVLLYQPKMIAVENQDTYTEQFIERASKFEIVKHKPQNIVSMYFGVQAGVQLLEKYCGATGAKYDLVIRMRPDMIFHQDLPDFDPANFYTIFHKSGEGRGTGDMLQASSYWNIVRFSKLAQSLEEVYAHTKEFCPHVLGEFYIRSLRVPHIEVQIHKTLQHTPNGQYNNWSK